MKNRKLISIFLYIAILSLAFSWLIQAFGIGQNDLSYSQVVQLLESGNVKTFYVHDGQIHMELYEALDGKTEVSAEMGDADAFRRCREDAYE